MNIFTDSSITFFYKIDFFFFFYLKIDYGEEYNGDNIFYCCFLGFAGQIIQKGK